MHTFFNVLTFQNPEYSGAYFEQSVPYNKRGDYAERFKLLNKAVEINPKRQKEYYDYIVDLKPNRVIFNPRTENFEFINLLKEKEIFS